MKATTVHYIDELTERYPALAELKEPLIQATEMLITAYQGGGKLLVCGNGGSAADSEHIVGELMKGFILPRRLPAELKDKLNAVCPQEAEYLYNNLQGTLPAISLVGALGLNTAFANDQAPDLCFAQQVLGLGKPGDILLAISTSGNSANVIYAVQMAKTLGLKTIAMTGESGGKLKGLVDVCLCAPSPTTFKIQEYHLPMYHMLCMAVENEFFSGKSS